MWTIEAGSVACTKWFNVARQAHFTHSVVLCSNSTKSRPGFVCVANRPDHCSNIHTAGFMASGFTSSAWTSSPWYVPSYCVSMAEEFTGE